MRKDNTHVDLSLELLDGLDGTRGDNNHTTANLLALDTTQKSTHVVTRLALPK